MFAFALLWVVSMGLKYMRPYIYIYMKSVMNQIMNIFHIFVAFQRFGGLYSIHIVCNVRADNDWTHQSVLLRMTKVFFDSDFCALIFVIKLHMAEFIYHMCICKRALQLWSAMDLTMLSSIWIWSNTDPESFVWANYIDVDNKKIFTFDACWQS